MDLSKSELSKEIIAIGESIKAHEAQMDLHKYAVKVDKYLLKLMENNLNKSKLMENQVKV